jgi:prepilin-type N-terminal cleavage/methylation domain-containing protein
MTITRLRAANQRMGSGGFTLVELLVAIAILALVMTGVVGLLVSSQRGFVRGFNEAEAVQTTRSAIARMTQELREAGVNPKNAVNPNDSKLTAITAQSATGFTIQNDWDGDCPPKPQVCLPDNNAVWVNGRQRGEQVTYAIDNTGTLRRQELGIDGAPQIIAQGLSQLGATPFFQYLDANGNPPATPDDIRSVVVTLRASPGNAASAGVSEVAISDIVRLRN